MTEKIPLMLVPENITKKWVKKLKGLGTKLLRYFPDIEISLKMTDLGMSGREFMAAAFINAIIMGGIFGGLMCLLFWSQGQLIAESILLGFVIGIGIFIMFMVLFSRYPDIIASKRADSIDRDLVFALKDLSLQISAGVSLYDAFVEVAIANYGATSEEFDHVVRLINSGKPMLVGLEEMALRTKSEYLKRTAWQIINTLQSGANIKKTLKRIIDDLAEEQSNRIKSYARELNLWSLIYMLFAVAVPSIGSTMIVILSSFAGFGITKGMFIVFMIICLIIQYVLIGFVRTRRPVSSI